MSDNGWVKLQESAGTQLDRFFGRATAHGYPFYGSSGCILTTAAEILSLGTAATFCPKHEATGYHDPSVRIAVREDGERILTICDPCGESPFSLFMSGDLPDCMAEYRAKERDRENGGSRGNGGKYVAEIECYDRYGVAGDGESLFRWKMQQDAGISDTAYYYPSDTDRQFAKVRFSKVGDPGWKTFKWCSYRFGRWIGSLFNTVPPLYGADKVKPDGIIWAVEGEKDVIRLQELGLSAVSTAIATGKGIGWPDLNFFSGREVVVIPDNDETGFRRRDGFARRAAEKAGSVKCLGPLGTRKGYDVSDWLDDGGTVGELRELAEQAEETAPPDPEPDDGETGDEPGSSWGEQSVAALLDGARTNGSPPDFLYADEGECILYRKKCAWIYGEPHAGKTQLATLAMAQEIRKGNHIIHLDMEEQAQECVENLLGLHGLDREQVLKFYHHVRPEEPFTDAGQKAYRALLAAHKPSLVVADSVNAYLTVDNLKPNDDDSILKMKIKLINPSIRAGAAVICIDNVVKDRESRDGWPKNSGQKKYVAWTGTEVVQDQVWTRTSSGYSRLVFHKDHAGYNDYSGNATAAYFIFKYSGGVMSCYLSKERPDWDVLQAAANGRTTRRRNAQADTRRAAVQADRLRRGETEAQRIARLAEQHDVSPRTIQRDLDAGKSA